MTEPRLEGLTEPPPRRAAAALRLAIVHADLQRLLADDLLTGFGELSMSRLRAIRSELTSAESDVSMVRRVTQGRLDIVGHGMDARAGDPTADVLLPGSDVSPDAPTLLFDMPDILGDGPSGSSRGARPAEVNEPGDVALALIEQLDGIVSPPELSNLGGFESGALGDLFERLRAMEIDLSRMRRQLHERIDLIQGEIGRRYRDGEASVDALLTESD